MVVHGLCGLNVLSCIFCIPFLYVMYFFVYLLFNTEILSNNCYVY